MRVYMQLETRTVYNNAIQMVSEIVMREHGLCQTPCCKALVEPAGNMCLPITTIILITNF